MVPSNSSSNGNEKISMAVVQSHQARRPESRQYWAFFKLGLTHAATDVLGFSVAGIFTFALIYFLTKSGNNFWQTLMPLFSHYFNQQVVSNTTESQQTFSYKH